MRFMKDLLLNIKQNFQKLKNKTLWITTDKTSDVKNSAITIRAYTLCKTKTLFLFLLTCRYLQQHSYYCTTM